MPFFWLVTCHMGPEPGHQGQMTVLEDGAGGDRHLVSAPAATPAVSPNRPSLPSCAPRAHPSGGPAQGYKILGTGLVAVGSVAPTPAKSGDNPRSRSRTHHVGSGGVKYLRTKTEARQCDDLEELSHLLEFLADANLPKPTGECIAIIGSGPAGLAEIG